MKRILLIVMVLWPLAVGAVDYSTTNYFQGLTAYASSAQYSTAADAVDGTTNTYWLSENWTNTDWVKVDCVTNTYIGKVEVVNYYQSSGGFLRYVWLEGSTDNTNWTEISSDEIGNAPTTWTVYFEPVTCRWYRVRCYQQWADNDWKAISEFRGYAVLNFGAGSTNGGTVTTQYVDSAWSSQQVMYVTNILTTLYTQLVVVVQTVDTAGNVITQRLAQLSQSTSNMLSGVISGVNDFRVQSTNGTASIMAAVDMARVSASNVAVAATDAMNMRLDQLHLDFTSVSNSLWGTGTNPIAAISNAVMRAADIVVEEMQKTNGVVQERFQQQTNQLNELLTAFDHIHGPEKRSAAYLISEVERSLWSRSDNNPGNGSSNVADLVEALISQVQESSMNVVVSNTAWGNRFSDMTTGIFSGVSELQGIGAALRSDYTPTSTNFEIDTNSVMNAFYGVREAESNIWLQLTNNASASTGLFSRIHFLLPSVATNNILNIEIGAITNPPVLSGLSGTYQIDFAKYSLVPELRWLLLSYCMFVFLFKIFKLLQWGVFDP